MEDPKEPVCQSYFFLKPEEASFLELLYLLCSSDVGKRRFIEIECSEEDVHNKVTEFRRRWVIFISVVLQWSLLFFRDPLARTGDVFDKWLNIISANGGLLMFFINRLKGKVVKPDSFTSELSVVGNVDWRIELDDNIKPKDTRYKGALSMMVVKWSYENEDLFKTVVNDHWKD
ncbi:PREDICTED: Lipase [Prunus dulcis]|uniref:PREDICTED: Lipase n=1 Tax=Prunus dulcis TaxID=3755 RepID=A0A5E4E9T4_PRUDU|nr:PREDICTED: Lipase [Prunus dulcis]